MSLNIDRAFVNTFIEENFGLETAYENDGYTPTAGTAYVELLNLPNDTTPFAYTASDQTDGIFRIILYWPANDGSIAAKEKAYEISNAFNVGRRVSYDGDYATIRNTSVQPGTTVDGWYKTLITIGYYAIIRRL